jgi:DNA-binding NarL/FixJ family response regulator
MRTPRIRVLCHNRHRLVRECIALAISRESDMEVVGSAATGDDTFRLVIQHRPDVTVMDLQSPSHQVIEAVQAIRRERADARIIALTMYRGGRETRAALAAGVAACVPKEDGADALVRFVREVHAGKRPNRLGAAAGRVNRQQQRLTPRELQVLELVSEGRRNRDIAWTLGISEVTVQVHLRNIFGKLRVRQRTAAVNVALRRGIVNIR